MSAISVEAREEFANDEARKETLGAIAGAAFHHLLEDAGSLAPTTVLETFVPVLRSAICSCTAWTPRCRPRGVTCSSQARCPSHDALAVVMNNAAVSRVDFYMERAVDYRVQLHRDGSASGRLRMTFANAAPASAPGGAVGSDGGDGSAS